MSADIQPRQTSMWVKAATFGGLAVLGGVVGYLTARFTNLPDSVPWDDALAFMMGIALIVMGALVAITMVFRPAAVVGQGGLQIVVFVLAGLMFLAPMMAPEFVAPQIVFAGVALAFALQTVANVIVWRGSDEMMRRLMTETSTIAFWGLQSAFFLYAAAERMALIQPVSAWGMAGILMAVYLVSSIVPSVRRGLA
ncbi:hypothetical protein ACETK8_03680 [Brevundimonas staleyi]|uniref:DUF308 domain-containing protein n=1 Tax=Brevundimonas staleyi TaxID=74326 RepID=A0ABW0FTP3_9CAUL